MTEPVDQSEPQGVDLNDSDIVSQLTSAMDSRFSGFQGVLDRNIGKLREEFASQLEEVSRKNLTPDELADLKETEKDAKLNKLEKENALLKLRKDYPDEVDFLSDWFTKDNFDDQLRLLNEFRNAKKSDGPTLTEEPIIDESESGPVDLNNPSRKGGESLATILRDVKSMTREGAQKLLEATNEKGILHRLRRDE